VNRTQNRERDPSVDLIAINSTKGAAVVAKITTGAEDELAGATTAHAAVTA
jgi:hypothetical protein